MLGGAARPLLAGTVLNGSDDGWLRRVRDAGIDDTDFDLDGELVDTTVRFSALIDGPDFDAYLVRLWR